MSDTLETRHLLQLQHTSAARKIKKVPFLELFNNRLQGVVSSGSDYRRVYVSFFEAGTGNYYCSTNNNRPCGGLRGSCCKHLQALLSEGILQYGAPKVATYLKIPGDTSVVKSAYDLMLKMSGTKKKEEANEVFSRFLNYLRFVELEGSFLPNPEMAWFVSG